MDFLALFLNSGKCYLCNQEENIICKKCFSKLEFITHTEQIGGCVSRSLYKYNHYSSKILLMSKYPPFNFYILKYLIQKTPKPDYLDNSLLCPVPLSSLKMYERKFNQAHLIAEEISKNSKYVVLNLLRRIRDTKPLFSLNKILRKKEVENVFRVSFWGRILPQKETLNIVLVDDLITSGETISQCIKALKDAGYPKIEVFSLFRA